MTEQCSTDPDPSADDTLLTVPQVAAITRTSPYYWYGLSRLKTVSPCRFTTIGRFLRIKRSDLDAFLALGAFGGVLTPRKD